MRVQGNSEAHQACGLKTTNTQSELHLINQQVHIYKRSRELKLLNTCEINEVNSFQMHQNAQTHFLIL